jgi:transposase
MEILQVALKYRGSESRIPRLRQRRRDNGEVAPRTRATPPPNWLPDAESIQPLIAERPDATHAELKAELRLPFSMRALCRGLRELRFTFKKSSALRSKTRRTSQRGGRSGGRGKAD